MPLPAPSLQVIPIGLLSILPAQRLRAGFLECRHTVREPYLDMFVQAQVVNRRLPVLQVSLREHLLMFPLCRVEIMFLT